MAKFNPLSLRVSNVDATWTREIAPPLQPDAVIKLALRSLSMQQFAAAKSRADELFAIHVTGSGIDKPIPIAPVDGRPVIVSRELASHAAFLEIAQDPNSTEDRYTAQELLQLMVDNHICRELYAVFLEVIEKSGNVQSPEDDQDPLASPSGS